MLESAMDIVPMIESPEEQERLFPLNLTVKSAETIDNVPETSQKGIPLINLQSPWMMMM